MCVFKLWKGGSRDFEESNTNSLKHTPMMILKVGSLERQYEDKYTEYHFEK